MTQNKLAFKSNFWNSKPLYMSLFAIHTDIIYQARKLEQGAQKCPPQTPQVPLLLLLLLHFLFNNS